MRVLDVMGKPIHVRQNGSHVRVWVGRGARPGYQDHTPFEVGMKVSALRSGAKRARRIPGEQVDFFILAGSVPRYAYLWPDDAGRLARALVAAAERATECTDPPSWIPRP
jgi:hypothetical protein